MTARARVALSDCIYALEQLDLVSTQQDWRFKWAGSIALIRAIGNILRNEGKENDLLAEAIRTRFRDHSAHRDRHRIYWKFIKRERDLVLKEYQSLVSEDEKIGVFVLLGGKVQAAELVDACIFKRIEDEEWIAAKGGQIDARDLYQEAISWWQTELDLIDHEMGKAS